MLTKLRSWWSCMQGLEGGWEQLPIEKCVEQCGWMRSVGGSNPYIGLFARRRFSREAIDAAVTENLIHELPSARGCTYVLPKSHYATALRLAKGKGETTEIKIAKTHLGVTDQEVDQVCNGVMEALKQGRKDPRELKDMLGDLVRNFGEAGKKRGQTTNLPLALGKLQVEGAIRRISKSGRLDTQSYAYELWPGEAHLPTQSYEEACAHLADLYFRWIGPATLAQFQWFSGLSQKASNEAVKELGLRKIEPNSEFWIHAHNYDEFQNFQPSQSPKYQLIAGIDNLFLLQRDVVTRIDANHLQSYQLLENGLLPKGHLVDLDTNAIVDRGQVVGIWEFDPDEGEIVASCWVPKTEELEAAISTTEAFIREDLGDARSFSLDSPKARQPKIAAIRALR